MITAYTATNGVVHKTTLSIGAPLPSDAVWIDLLAPSIEEVRAVQQTLGIVLPASDEMREIEVSSRLYMESGASYMVADIVARSETAHPETQSVTFVLTKRALVTVRFVDTHPFATFSSLVMKQQGFLESSEAVLLGLVETIIGRAGQLLRDLVRELDQVSRVIFWKPNDDGDQKSAKIGLQSALHRIGHMGEIASRVQQSLLSIDRLVVFYSEYAKPKNGSPLETRLGTMRQDIRSLSEHATFLSQKVGFLLDATLGFITAEQNQIIKIFSIAAVILLPPTLVATIYGMNFHDIPELGWRFGYPYALILMFFSAIIPYWYFKRRDWI